MSAEPCIEDFLSEYEEARGVNLTGVVTTGRKVAEEATELVIEVVRSNGYLTPELQWELADVVLAAAVVARAFGTTVEQCLAEKIVRDRGRDL